MSLAPDTDTSPLLQTWRYVLQTVQYIFSQQLHKLEHYQSLDADLKVCLWTVQYRMVNYLVAMTAYSCWFTHSKLLSWLERKRDLARERLVASCYELVHCVQMMRKKGYLLSWLDWRQVLLLARGSPLDLLRVWVFLFYILILQLSVHFLIAMCIYMLNLTTIKYLMFTPFTS